MKLTIYIYSMCLYLIWKLFKFKANSFPRGGSLKKKSTERKDRRLRSGNDREGSLVGRKAKSPTQVGGWGREKVFAIFLVFTSMASCSVSESCDLPPGSTLSRSPTCTSLFFLVEGTTTECSQKASFLYYKYSKTLSKCSQGILVSVHCLVYFLQSLKGLRPCVSMEILTIHFCLTLSGLWPRLSIPPLMFCFHWAWCSVDMV